MQKKLKPFLFKSANANIQNKSAFAAKISPYASMVNASRYLMLNARKETGRIKWYYCHSNCLNTCTPTLSSHPYAGIHYMAVKQGDPPLPLASIKGNRPMQGTEPVQPFQKCCFTVVNCSYHGKSCFICASSKVMGPGHLPRKPHDSMQWMQVLN